MPEQTQQAVNWAVTQTYYNPWSDLDVSITANTPEYLVDKVREYFNTNNIAYNTFSYDDLIPYLPN